VHDGDFKRMTAQLVEGGIPGVAAKRAVDELQDHFCDLVEAEISKGARHQDACQYASDRLGSPDVFVTQMLSRRELKSWAFRHPRTALLVYPLACLASLPAMPLMAGAANAASVARWGAILLLVGCVTAVMLLGMQLSIILG